MNLKLYGRTSGVFSSQKRILGDIGTSGFCIIFLYMDKFMFLKPANSDTEMALQKNQNAPEKNQNVPWKKSKCPMKKIKMSHEKKYVKRRLDSWKRHFLK